MRVMKMVALAWRVTQWSLLVIDIGSSQIIAAVAEITEDRRIAVRGLGRARSGGLKQGVVIQIDSVVDALARSVAEANQMAGTKLTDPLVSVGGSHILGQNISGTVILNHHEVTDIRCPSDGTSASPGEISDREILSVIPRSFTLDSQTGIRLPRGDGKSVRCACSRRYWCVTSSF